MKIGISIYCLDNAMAQGMTPAQAIDWAADHGCEHIEFVPFHLPLVDEKSMALNTALIDEVREKCLSRGLEISTYSVNADLINADESVRKHEIERVKLHIDAAERLGIHLMRHDIASFRRPFDSNTPENFEKELPLMVVGSRELYDYASAKGITTTLENHGFFCNGSDRMVRLIKEIDRPELSLTLDVGNFHCVDEFGYAAVKKCIKYAKVIHFKDFYIRQKWQLPNQNEMFNCDNGSWFETLGGHLLRGSIVGQGDTDIWEVARAIKAANYDGYISVEFEGMEPCERATDISLSMTRAILRQA